MNTTVGQRQRMVWMDFARGLAIVLVMVSHMANFGRQEGLFAANQFMDIIDRIGVVLRMPLLMFLSGMLVPRSLAKGWRKFLPGKFTKLFWPYAIWLTAWAILNWNHGIGSPKDLLPAIIHPLGAEGYMAGTTLWYLWYLFIFYMLVQLAQLLRIPLWILLGVAFADSAIKSVGALNGDYTLIDTRMSFLFVFFVAGMMAMEHIGTIVAAGRNLAASVFLAGLAASPIIVMFDRDLPITSRYSFFFIAGALAFLILVVSWVSIVPKNALTAPIMYVGRNSLYYYVSHACTYIGYCWWIGWRFDAPYAVHAFAMLFLGFALPTIAIELSKIIPPVKWLFEFPLKRP